MNTLLREKDNFYPTPAALADKMCEIIEPQDKTFLEPSGGKGDLVDAILRKLVKLNPYGSSRYASEKAIDIVEIDPDLRGILKSKYSDEEIQSIRTSIDFLKGKKDKYDPEERRYKDIRTEEEKEAQSILETRKEELCSSEIRIVHDDFLNYRTRKHYDVILMNPPFDRGAEHLLHALSLIRDGGKVVCLLNQETLLNPYTKERLTLQAELSSLNAEIEYLPMEFMAPEAERKTEVTVALVKVSVPRADQTYKSKILEGLKEAKEEKTSFEEAEATAVSSKTNWIDSLIEEYEFEVDAGLGLYREYLAIKPYMCAVYDPEERRYAGEMLSLRSGDSRDFKPNEFVELVREKYWRKFFNNPQFSNALTSNLSNVFYNIVSDAKNYEFSRYNIEEILKKMSNLMMEAREETILNLFEQVSNKHSWYPECGNNIHYYSGWKTNTAHKINDVKVIIPLNGVYAEKWRGEALDTYHICRTLLDMEKVFDYLAVGSNDDYIPYDLAGQINHASQSFITKDISLKYFSVTFYKKGTCHIKFREETKKLVEKLNILGSKKKAWLPPNYGKVRYENLTDEEKEVIDSFQGKKSYDIVCNNADYYLSDFSGDTSGMFLLPA